MSSSGATVNLSVPDGGEEQLERRIQVKVPELEREHPERNDALLSDLAHSTGGVYYVGPESVLGKAGLPEPERIAEITDDAFLAIPRIKGADHDAR